MNHRLEPNPIGPNPIGPNLTRRDFTRLSVLTLLALFLDACASPPPPIETDPPPTATSTPLPAATLPPSGVTPTATQSPSPTPPTPVPDTQGLERAYHQATRRIDALVKANTPSHARLVVRPIKTPHLEINFGGGDVQRAASTIKAMILLYALFKQPTLDLTPPQNGQSGSDVYRMIVSSHNTATARVLASAAALNDLPVSEALNAFNDFLHEVLELPGSVGLTRWNYGMMSGVTTDRLTPPVTPAFTNGIPNPITLTTLADFYQMLETPSAIEAAAERAGGHSEYLKPAGYTSPDAYISDIILSADRARSLLAIPDPGYQTQMDLALYAMRQTYPDLRFDMYGKNGTISPADWSLNRWHINEGGVVIISDDLSAGKYVITFSSSSFNTSNLLGEALDYCVNLFRQGA